MIHSQNSIQTFGGSTPPFLNLNPSNDSLMSIKFLLHLFKKFIHCYRQFCGWSIVKNFLNFVSLYTLLIKTSH